jgi:hypothetical protein
MEMNDIVKKYIDRIIIPKYGELNYEILGRNYVNVRYYNPPFDEVHGITEDTQLILKMLGLSDIAMSYNRNPWYIVISGEK